MSKYPLAVVIALAFLAGGAAAVVYHFPPGGADSTRAAAENGDVAGSVSGPAGEPVDSQAADGAYAVEKAVSSLPDGPAGLDVEAGAAPAGVAVRRPESTRGRAVDDGRTYRRTGAARSQAKVPRAVEASGGRGLAGHALNGVKKTGEGVKKTGTAIGRTFGKIGGVFHD